MKRLIAEELVREHQLSVQRACRVVRLSRTAYYQPPVPASRRDAPAIAVLTDADDTKSTAQGDYADFRACKG